MSTVTRKVNAGADQIFAVLADGWTFSSWVVGAAHIRDVDHHWPQPGARIHHSVGAWPLLVNDATVVRDVKNNEFIDLQAKVWPFGEARVRILLESISDTETLIRMDEFITKGLGVNIPDKLIAPFVRARNGESLQRLADIAIHRKTGQHQSSPDSSI